MYTSPLTVCSTAIIVGGQSKPAISTTGTMAGRKSQCEPLAEAILAKVEVGLSARRIYQDLVEENGFADSYESVKRFVRKQRASHPERVWRLECQPGEELQLDFGLGAPIVTFTATVTSKWPAPFTKSPPNTSATRCGCAGTAAACAFSISGWNRSRSTPELNQAVLVGCWAQEA